MAKGTSIRIFLVDGTPDGLRLIEKSLWTGIGIVCSRNQYPAARKREEFSRPGIYVLYGPDPEFAGRSLVYVGQAEIVRDRLDQHAKSKDFWTNLIAFTNKDANLNNAHFRYLESRLVALGQQAKRAKLENGNQPTMPQLSEAERADAEAFLENMLLIYPLTGIDAFEVVTQVELEPNLNQEKGSLTTFTISGRGVTASGQPVSDGFLVRANSQAAESSVPSFTGSYLALRDELIASAVLVPDGNHFRFVQDYVFRSPSAAGGVVLGRNANGRLEWKSTDGRTLAQVQDEQINTSPIVATGEVDPPID